MAQSVPRLHFQEISFSYLRFPDIGMDTKQVLFEKPRGKERRKSKMTLSKGHQGRRLCLTLECSESRCNSKRPLGLVMVVRLGL
jgi:hypothetical protein